MNSFEKLKNEGIIILDQIIPKELFVKIKSGFFEHDKFLESCKLKDDKKDLLEKELDTKELLIIVQK